MMIYIHTRKNRVKLSFIISKRNPYLDMVTFTHTYKQTYTKPLLFYATIYTQDVYRHLRLCCTSNKGNTESIYLFNHS